MTCGLVMQEAIFIQRIIQLLNHSAHLQIVENFGHFHITK